MTLSKEAELEWMDIAKAHFAKKEWVAANLAGEISDSLRFYRLHLESKAFPKVW